MFFCFFCKQFIFKKLNIELLETIDNRQESYVNRRVHQEKTKDVVKMIKSEMLSNSIDEQQSHWINQTTNNGANLYLYSAYYVIIGLFYLNSQSQISAIEVSSSC